MFGGSYRTTVGVSDSLSIELATGGRICRATFSYDNLCNMTVQNVGGTLTTNTYDDDNRMKKITHSHTILSR